MVAYLSTEPKSHEAQLSRARAFVFDFYGTLVEDHTSIPPMWKVLNAHGYRSHPDLEAAFEPNAFDGVETPTLRSTPSHDDWNRANWRRFLVLSGVPEAHLDSELEHIFQVQRRYRARSVIGAPQLLEFLRSHGRRIGLCSNWESPIEPFLEDVGLSGFDAIVTSALAGFRKPHPRIFQIACHHLGVHPSEAVLVGDTWNTDVVGALRFGLHPVWIRHANPPRTGLEHLVFQVTSLDQLTTTLESALAKD